MRKLSEILFYRGEEGEICRFCYSAENTKENPLLSICKCTGSLGFVHFICLKGWLNFKLLVKKQANLASYFWKSFECEICKEMYPGMKIPLYSLFNRGHFPQWNKV